MTSDPEAGDVCGGFDTVTQGELRCGMVQSFHFDQRRLELGRIHLAGFEGVDQHASAQGLGEDELLSRASIRVGQDLLGVGLADDGQAELELVVLDRVTAEEHGSRLGDRLGSPLQNLAVDTVRDPLGREAADVERKQGFASHGKHIGQRVCSRNPAIAKGVVADRSDEVQGRDQGFVP